MPGLIAILEAIPMFLEILMKLGAMIVRFVNYAEQNKLDQWINDLESAMDKLEASKTPKEKIESAQAIANIIRGIGP